MTQALWTLTDILKKKNPPVPACFYGFIYTILIDAYLFLYYKAVRWFLLKMRYINKPHSLSQRCEADIVLLVVKIWPDVLLTDCKVLQFYSMFETGPKLQTPEQIQVEQQPDSFLILVLRQQVKQSKQENMGNKLMSGALSLSI